MRELPAHQIAGSVTVQLSRESLNAIDELRSTWGGISRAECIRRLIKDSLSRTA